MSMLGATHRLELFDGFEALDEGTWDRLLANSPAPTIFQTKAWLQAWWETFGRGKLMLVCIHQRDQLSALAPLFADNGMVFFVGSGGSDYLDFVGSPMQPEIMRDVLEFARSQVPDFVGFRFYHVPDTSSTGIMLSAAGPQAGLDCFDEGFLEAPALRFEDWLEGERLPEDKKSLVRHERRLQKEGKLLVEHLVDHSGIEPLLPAFFEQHIRRWATTPFPSLFLDEKQRDFYLRLCRSPGSRGWLRFTQVTLDQRPVAFHFGFLFRNVFLWYKPTFDIDLAHLSPGEVLLRSLLVQSREENAQVFDFGIGDEPFKKRFLTETVQIRTWGLYPTAQHPVCGECVS